MAQRSSLRLIKCPKCANLLQELHGCSVFKCGACGAVLRAKKREHASDGGNSAETTESIGDTCEHERESYDGNAKNGRILSSGARADHSIVNSAMDKREGSAYHQTNYSRDKSAGLRLDRRRAQGDTAYAFDYRQRPEDRVSKIVERGFGVNSPQFKHDLAASGAKRERWSFTGDHFEGFLRDSRIVTEREGACRHLYPEEGPSNYYGSPSSFGYGEVLGSRDDVTARDRVRVLERERVELISKLDELANQINQSSNMGNRLGAEDIVCHRKSIASGDPYYAHAGFDILNEPLVLESPIRKPPHSKQGRESISSMESHEMETLNSYFSPWDGQLNLLENPRRSFLPGTMRPFHQYAHEPPKGHLPEEYMGFDRDPSLMYPNQHLHHRPSCTCSSCYYKYGGVPPQFSTNTLSSSKTFDDRFDCNPYHQVNPVKIRPQNTRQSGDSTSSSNSKYSYLLQMWWGDSDMDTEDFVWSQPKRSMVSHQNRKHYHPIAGAAPFIACLNCLELLKLPTELIIKEKCDKQKLRCGGCSAIILFKIENKKLVTFMKKGSSGGAVKDGGNDIQISSTCSDSGGINSDTCVSATRTSSDPYRVTSKCTLAGDDSLLEVRPQNTSKSGKMHGLQSPAFSSPSFFSKEEDSPDSLIAQCNAPAEYNTSPKPQTSQIPEHFDESSTNGNENSRMNQEGVSLVKYDTCQSTREDASTMMKFEVPLNDYLHTGLSLLEVQPQSASDSGMMQGLLSPASSSPSFHSEEGESPDNVIAHSNVLSQSKNNTSLELQTSHVPKHFDNSSSYENEKSRMDQERVSVEKNNASQSTSNDASATSKVEVPLNEDSHTELSHDSTDTGKEAKDKFAGLSKSHGEFQSLENGKPKVTVNGHLIADDIIEMAEKLAGPVFPGDYWYDFQAGFWGVMNQPCLGIIPPFIKEFKYPLPENCAAGNTSIFINGRELNQRDLDLLASRGLPRTRNRFYAIDISGIVLDEKTREVLYNLGKLAPTVERAQRGFGMRVPEVV